MSYKVGDTVRVISIREVNTYEEAEDGRRVDGLLFNYSMFEYCDGTFTIEKHWDNMGEDRYRLDNVKFEDLYSWGFSNAMLISVNSELINKLTPDMSFNEALL